MFLFTNLLYIIYFGYANPHEGKVHRRMEYFNEISLQLTSYHLCLFPIVQTLEDEQMFGWSMIGFIVGIFALNLIAVLVMAIITIKRKLYLRKLRKKWERVKPI